MKRQLWLLFMLLACVCGANAATYTRVTSVSDLNDTDEFILVSASPTNGQYYTVTSVSAGRSATAAATTVTSAIPELTELKDEITIADNFSVTYFQFQSGYYLTTTVSGKSINIGIRSSSVLAYANTGTNFIVTPAVNSVGAFKLAYSAKSLNVGTTKLTAVTNAYNTAIYKKSTGGSGEDPKPEKTKIKLSFEDADGNNVDYSTLNANLGETFVAPKAVAYGTDDVKIDGVAYPDIYYAAIEDNGDVVDINEQTGEITLKAAGEATIRAYISDTSEKYEASGSKYVSYTINVTKNKAQVTLTSSVSEITLNHGDVAELPVITADGRELTDADGLKFTVNMVDDVYVAYIDPNDNKIHTVRDGSANLQVSLVSDDYEAEPIIIPVTVTINKPTLTLALDKTEVVTERTVNPVYPVVTATDADGNPVELGEFDVVYSSDNESVISYYNGIYPGIYGIGTATVTAKLADDFEYTAEPVTFTVTVTKSKATIKVSVDKYELDIKDAPVEKPTVTVVNTSDLQIFPAPTVKFAAVATNDGTDGATEVFEYDGNNVKPNAAGKAYLKVWIESSSYEAEPVYIEVVVTEPVASTTITLAEGCDANSVRVYRGANWLGDFGESMTVNYADGWDDADYLYIVGAEGYYLTSVVDGEGNEEQRYENNTFTDLGDGELFYVNRRAAKAAYTVTTIKKELDPAEGMINWTKPAELNVAQGGALTDGATVTTGHVIKANGVDVKVTFGGDVQLIAENGGIEVPAGTQMMVSAVDRNVFFNSITFVYDGENVFNLNDKGVLADGQWTAVVSRAASDVQDVNFANNSEVVKVKTMTINYTSVTTGIEQTETVAVGEAEYFDLQGRRVINPTAGLYIRVLGGKADKVLVK